MSLQEKVIRGHISSMGSHENVRFWCEYNTPAFWNTKTRYPPNIYIWNSKINTIGNHFLTKSLIGISILLLCWTQLTQWPHKMSIFWSIFLEISFFRRIDRLSTVRLSRLLQKIYKRLTSIKIIQIDESAIVDHF